MTGSPATPGVRSRRALGRAAATGLALAWVASGQQPQDVPDMPRPEEIVARVGALLDAAPERSHALEPIGRVVYAEMPTDVAAVALRFGQTLEGSQAPRGLPLEKYVRQFEPNVARGIEERLASGCGKLELRVALRQQRTSLPVGTHGVGVVLQGGRLAGLVIRTSEDPKAKPVALQLKLRRPELPPLEHGALVLRLLDPDAEAPGAADRASPTRVRLLVALRGQEAVTTKDLTVAE